MEEVCMHDDHDPNIAYGTLYHYANAHKNRCAFCENDSFTDKISRDNHMKNVHKKFPCLLCWRVFDTNQEMQYHRSNPKTHPFRCNICRKEFSGSSEWWLHIFREHAAGCIICNVTMDNTFSEKFHRDAHYRDSHHMFPCEKCWSIFFSEVTLQHHFKDKHRNACTICDKTFGNENDCNRHFNSAHKVKCFMCDESYRSETNLQNHFKAKHIFACNTCGQEFPDDVKRLEHNLSAHKVKCDKCGVYLDTETHLRYHYESEHLITCHSCVKTFDSESEREKHFNLIHKIKCPVCYETFDTKATADKHFQLVHVLKCDMCVKVCTTITELQLHYSVIHQVQPIQQQNSFGSQSSCGVCHLCFATEEALIDHYQVRHVEK